MAEATRKAVIIGGGITGLSAAYYLQKEIQRLQVPLEVKLVEASHKLGGKIQTAHRSGFLIEKGPDSLFEGTGSVLQLASAVGLESQIVRSARGTSYILSGGRLHPIPAGMETGIPARLLPLFKTRLLSTAGKLRAAADIIIPGGKYSGDQPLGAYLRRRLGNEVVNQLSEPMLSSIFGGDIDSLSLAATFPQIDKMQKKHRSLIAGMREQLEIMGQPYAEKGHFVTLKKGLGSLVAGLEGKLEPGSVLKGTRVEKVKKTGSGAYSLHLSNGQKLYADTVIAAIPHKGLPALFPELSSLNSLKKDEATSVAAISMAFQLENMPAGMDGIGFVVPSNSDYTITACTWEHRKWPHTVPEGYGMLRCYIGRTGNETVVGLSDEEIEQIVLDDLSRILEITSRPLFTFVSRWKNAMPQYTIGYPERAKMLAETAGRHYPGIFVAGCSFKGNGIPAFMEQGQKAAELAFEYLQFKKEI